MAAPPSCLGTPPQAFATVAYQAAPPGEGPTRPEPLPAVPPVPPVQKVPAAEAGVPGSQPLTLEALEQLALQYNPTLSMAGAEVEKEVGNWTQVGLYPNPTLGYLRTDPSKAGQSRTDGAFVQQQIITGRKLRINREIETFGLQNASWQQEAQRQRVLNDVRMRFYQALGEQERVMLAERMVQIAEEGVTTVRQLMKAMEASEVDLLQAEIQLNMFRSSLQNARGHYGAAWEQLADMVGMPTLEHRPLTGQLAGDQLPQIDPQQVWEQLLNSNALLQSVRSQVGVARKTWERQRVQPIPDVTVQVVGEVDHTNDFSSVNTLLALPVPVFNRNQGAVYNAWYDLQRARNEVDRTVLVLRDLFAASLRDFNNARNDVALLEKEILPRAERSLELTKRGYAAGEFDLLRVLSVQKSYFDANMSYIDAWMRLRQATVELDGLQLTGGLNPATIGAAIQGGGEMGQQRRAVQGLLEQQQSGGLKLYNPGTTPQ